MIAIKIDNLSKSFDKTEALKKLNFEVKDKEFFCLLGRPGAGKTTTLRLIAGLEKADDGNIYIRDKLVNDVLPSDRDVAMIFQNLALYPAWTGFENLAFTLKLHKVPPNEINKRVKEVANTLRINHLLDRRPATFSGGERQRLAIGRALVRRPQVFLMDEPLSNLDALLRLDMRVELKRLQTELGQTIIYSTPDQLEAMSMADRIAIMREGKIHQISDPDSVYDRPNDKFVAEFIGSPSMNFIDCSLLEKDGNAFLDTGEFQLDVTKLKETIKKEATSSEIMMGIRPEHINIHRKKISESFETTVIMQEPLGSETILHLKRKQILFKAIVPPTFESKFGEKVWAEFNREKLYILDGKTEKVII
ncbi:MAG: ABC transporter ATP-binding protein [Candidatus Bathyarchaeota archaeon]|nr:ABC transporter ATP-binding protein [Candidatus Bathyarchaeota archaeon]